MPISEQQVLDALRAVQDPDLRRDIVTLGFVRELRIEGDSVAFQVQLTTPACPVKEQLQAECEQQVRAIPGVREVRVEMTAQVRTRQADAEDLIPGVKHTIAVASGKGGVGKSTVTVNLAIALAQLGAKVGVMDADVYGPSIPLMLGCKDDRPLSDGGKIVPIERFGIHVMSLGFLLEEGQAVLWRGPMVAATVKQLLADVTWGELDYLLVDLPPGTGDAPMTLAQIAPLTGVVIVTTPHNVAANIAGKSAALFRRLNTPLLGVVENMGTFLCPGCETETRIFSGMGGEELAQTIQVPYLGSVPLDPRVSGAADEGSPAIVAFPQTRQAEAFREIAGRLAQQISIRDHGRLGVETAGFPT